MKIGFLPALGLLFIGLKLGHIIDWDWIWVLAPVWIPAAFGSTVLLIIFIAALCGATINIKRNGVTEYRGSLRRRWP